MWPLSSCKIKISLVSQCRSLRNCHDCSVCEHTAVSLFFFNCTFWTAQWLAPCWWQTQTELADLQQKHWSQNTNSNLKLTHTATPHTGCMLLTKSTLLPTAAGASIIIWHGSTAATKMLPTKKLLNQMLWHSDADLKAFSVANSKISMNAHLVWICTAGWLGSYVLFLIITSEKITSWQSV